MFVKVEIRLDVWRSGVIILRGGLGIGVIVGY